LRCVIAATIAHHDDFKLTWLDCFEERVETPDDHRSLIVGRDQD
jgi:hypothetical protein